MDLARQLRAEFAPVPKFDPTRNYSMEADKLVSSMLEDGEQLDAHVKAHGRVQKWDKAHSTYQDLYAKHLKARALFAEMGRSIGYERALARAGISRADVANQIHGAQIGATHNFKGQRNAKVCKDTQYCAQGRMRRKQTGEVCGDCGGPTMDALVPYAPSDLRGRFANYMFGVDTNDGRRVWFDEPLPPQPEAKEAPPEGPAPVTQEEREQQKRVGKWW